MNPYFGASEKAGVEEMSNIDDAAVMVHSGENIFFLQLRQKSIFSVQISVKTNYQIALCMLVLSDNFFYLLLFSNLMYLDSHLYFIVCPEGS